MPKNELRVNTLESDGVTHPKYKNSKPLVSKSLKNFKKPLPTSRNSNSGYKISQTHHNLTDIVSLRETIVHAKGFKYVKGYHCIDMFDDFTSFNSFRVSDRQ
jgi:hypothetical protein